MANADFILHSAEFEQLLILEDDEVGQIMRKMFEFIQTGVEPELADRAHVIVWNALKIRYEYDRDTYKTRCEQNRANVSKRWHKSSSEDTTVYDGIRPHTNDTNNNNNINNNINNININNKKEKDIPIGISKKKSAERFTPPTINEVVSYCKEHGLKYVDPDRFIDHYQSKGWMIGKNRMKDWKAAVRNWDRSERQELATKPKSQKNSFHNFPQRDMDYHEVENQLDQQFAKEWG